MRLAPHTSARRPRILILVENLAVPFDRRVWQEARTLQEAGYDVCVICPQSAQHPESTETLEGVHIYRYPSPFEARRTAGYLIEYPLALMFQFVLAIKIARAGRIDAIQACNPPDLLFLVALPFRLLTGTRFIFDHHDASPELLIAKGRQRRSWIVRFAKLLERWTFSGATVSMATNESYRRIAIERGGMAPDDVFVVRSGPDLSRFAAAHVDPELRRGKKYLVAYVGVMGIQEGIDYLLEAADLLVNRQGRTDVQFTLAGSGPEFGRVVERVAEQGDARLLDLRVPAAIDDVSIPLGSITIDGVSLTINAMPAPRVIQISLIPFTLQHTTLEARRAGDGVHLESDTIGKYVSWLMRGRGADV